MVSADIAGMAAGLFVFAVMKTANLIGERFGRLMVIRFSHSKNGAVWLCRCDCGNETLVRTSILRCGSTNSCGCGSREAALNNYSEARDRRKVPYPHSRKMKDMYSNMQARCYDPSNKRWKNYGARGIKICAEWLTDIRAFYKWVFENGWEPGLTIDRINVNGDYEPSNCRFATALVQMNNTTRNRRLTWNGRTMTVTEWARKLGVRSQAIQHRVDRDWTIERIFTQPFRAPRR